MEQIIGNAMKNYEVIEATEFEGLMPVVIDELGGIGSVEEPKSVEMHGFEALGHEPLEVVDVEELMK